MAKKRTTQPKQTKSDVVRLILSDSPTMPAAEVVNVAWVKYRTKINQQNVYTLRHEVGTARRVAAKQEGTGLNSADNEATDLKPEIRKYLVAAKYVDQFADYDEALGYLRKYKRMID